MDTVILIISSIRTDSMDLESSFGAIILQLEEVCASGVAPDFEWWSLDRPPCFASPSLESGKHSFHETISSRAIKGIGRKFILPHCFHDLNADGLTEVADVVTGLSAR
jgi:hypothetical protein